MSRPRKQTVDYFPHDTDASESKTLTIIQEKYGNDGYAFWFKLLQLLGRKPGHYYDFNKPADWEFLLAKTHIKDTETAKGILDTLSILEAIDLELYQSGIIWCQKFVNRITDAYTRREDDVPIRPEVGVSVSFSGVSDNNNSITTDRNNPLPPPIPPPIPLNKTKLNKTKLNKNNKELSLSEDIFELYEKEIGKLTETIKNLVNDALENFPEDWVRDAIKEAVRQNKRKWSYIEAILKNWKNEGRSGKKEKTDPDRFVKGKYGHMVQR